MAVTFIEFQSSAAGTGTLTISVNPASTPKGAFLVIVQTDDSADQVGTPDYGGVNFTEVTGSPLVGSGGESINTNAFFLGSSIPTGAQTITIPVTGAGDKRAGIWVLGSGGGNTELVDVDNVNGAAADPSVNLASGGSTCIALIGFGSGFGTLSSVTPNSGWTGDLENDFGPEVAGWYRRTTIDGTDPVACGYSSGGLTDDVVLIAALIREVAGAASHAGQLVNRVPVASNVGGALVS